MLKFCRMGRTKELAKKSRHDDAGSSRQRTRVQPSRRQQPENVPQRAIPEELGTRPFQNLSPVERALVDVYRGKRLSEGRFFEPNMLREFGCEEEVYRLLQHPQLGRLFVWRGPTYSPITYEFIATLDIRREINNARQSIKFSLFVQRYHLSVNDIVVALGFHNQAEVSMRYFNYFKSDFDTDRDATNYWVQITNGRPYHSCNLKAKYITTNYLKAIRLALTVNLSGRKTNRNKAYRQDLFYMWRMENRVNVNMDTQVKKWLQSQTRQKVQVVFVGPLVIRLCQGLGIGNHLEREKNEGSMVAFAVREFQAMYIKWGGDNAPAEGVEGSTNEEDDEETQEQDEPNVQERGD